MICKKNKIARHGVIPNEKGIIKKEGRYFYESSDFTKKLHHYIIVGAKYHCDSSYTVKRDYLDSFILFFIKKGSLTFEYRGKQFTANEDEMVLLDCKYENMYYANDFVVFDWFHFSGGLSQQLCDQLYSSVGSLLTKERALQAQNNFNKIFNLLTSDINTINENKISVCIYELLCSFFYIQNNEESMFSDNIKNSVLYIHQHYSEPIYLEELSQLSNLSLYHFSRVFKKEIGVSPHKYIMNIRIIEAKKKLVETLLSIEEISFLCGFNSRSHFIRSFVKSTGLTPGEFRKVGL